MLYEDLWRSIWSGPREENMVTNIGTASTLKSIAALTLRRKAHDRKCMNELRGALPLVVYGYVRGRKNAKDIRTN